MYKEDVVYVSPKMGKYEKKLWGITMDEDDWIRRKYTRHDFTMKELNGWDGCMPVFYSPSLRFGCQSEQSSIALPSRSAAEKLRARILRDEESVTDAGGGCLYFKDPVRRAFWVRNIKKSFGELPKAGEEGAELRFTESVVISMPDWAVIQRSEPPFGKDAFSSVKLLRELEPEAEVMDNGLAYVKNSLLASEWKVYIEMWNVISMFCYGIIDCYFECHGGVKHEIRKMLKTFFGISAEKRGENDDAEILMFLNHFSRRFTGKEDFREWLGYTFDVAQEVMFRDDIPVETVIRPRRFYSGFSQNLGDAWKECAANHSSGGPFCSSRYFLRKQEDLAKPDPFAFCEGILK